MLRSNLLLSSSLPSSYQSPEVKRKSWNAVAPASSVSAALLDSDSAEPPANYEEAKAEDPVLNTAVIEKIQSVLRFVFSDRRMFCAIRIP